MESPGPVVERSRLRACLASSQQHQVGDIEDHDEKPNDDRQDGDVPGVRHHDHGRGLRTDLLVVRAGSGLLAGEHGPLAALDADPGLPGVHDHVLVEAREPDEGGGDEGQHDAEHDLRAVERVVEQVAARGAGDDDAGRDGDGAGDEAALPRLDAPADGALADHLARDGAHDAGRHAGEEERQGEDDARERADGRREQVVDAEDVGGRGRRVAVEARAGDDEDGAVDEEGERHEGDGHLCVGVFQRIFNGRETGHVECLLPSVYVFDGIAH